MAKLLSIFLAFILFVVAGFASECRAADSLLEQGIAEYKAENYEEAKRIFEEAKKQHPDSATLHYYLGLTQKQTGDFDAAVKDLREALSLSPPAVEAYGPLIEILYSLNDLKDAGEWIAKAEKDGAEPGRIAFLKGLVLAKEGRDDEAIAFFQRAKELDKTLAQQADFQIAVLYAKARKTREAEDRLKAVIAIDPTSDVAAFAKEYERAVREMERYTTWRFTAGLAYQYDDNVVLKPSSAVPGVVITGEKDSSIMGAFRMDYTPMSSSRWFLSSQLNLYTNTYFSTHSHSMISPTITVSPGYRFTQASVSLPVLYNYTWLNGKDYESVLSARPVANIVIRPGHIGQLSAGYARRDLLERVVDSDENRDGDIYSASAGYIHPFAGDRGVFNLRYEFSLDNTTGKNWENTGHRFNMGILTPVSGPVSLALSGEVFLQDYRNTHTIFSVKRKDKVYFGSANIIWEVARAVNLNLAYSHTTADSNIALYDYDRNVYAAGIEYRF